MYFISGLSQIASFKSASYLLNHASDVSDLRLVLASDFGVTKSSHESSEQYPCIGTSALQLQLDFVSHLMRIGQRLSQLPTKELRGTLNYNILFMLHAIACCLRRLAGMIN